MPSPTTIFKMLKRSPIGPLQAHMAKAAEAAQGLVNFFDAVLEKDWARAQALQAHISELERDADTLKKELRMNLPKGLFMPVSRGDLLELLHRQDQVADKAKDIAGLIFGRKMEIPESLAPQLKSLLQRSVDAALQANKAICELDELYETGFRGKEASYVSNIIEELNDIEYDTDQLQNETYQVLFRIEDNLPPVKAVFLYKIIDWIGELADYAQTVGGRLQLLLAR